MTQLTETLCHFETGLRQSAPKIYSRLQPGLAIADIETQIDPFSWQLPQDAYALYQWHNGLSGKPRTFNLLEKLIRLKGKWHGELSGRENEAHVQLGKRLIIAKFLPLEYALAGHRHLKLGRCPIDLLPFSVLVESEATFYCMMRLDPTQPTIFCANGTHLPPMKVTEAFLSTQPQFSQMSDLVTFLTKLSQIELAPSTTNLRTLMDDIDYIVNAAQ
jgi:hypothetical protein